MTTPLEFFPPASIPDDRWLSKLGSLLVGRNDIAAAYLVTTRYFDPPALQDELHLELNEPPDEERAPPALLWSREERG